MDELQDSRSPADSNVSRPKWRTPTLTEDAIADVTRAGTGGAVTDSTTNQATS